MSHALRDELRNGPSRRKFFNHGALVQHLQCAVALASEKQRLQVHEVLEGLLTALVAAVQRAAPVGEHEMVGRMLADEMQRRLTVKSHSDDDHPRRWV